MLHRRVTKQVHTAMISKARNMPPKPWDRPRFQPEYCPATTAPTPKISRVKKPA